VFLNHISCHNNYFNLSQINTLDDTFYNFVFVHIPKNGGTSINYIIKQHMTHWVGLNNIDDGTLNMLSKKKYNCLNFKHSSFKTFKHPEKLICFVRNPYSRIISLFFYHKLNRTYTFKEFVTQMYNNKKLVNYIQNNEYHTSIKFNLIKYLYSYKLQSYWIPDDIFFCGKLENVNDDLNTLFDKMNIQLNESTIIHKNKTNHDSYLTYYDDETKKMVYEIYKSDFEQFNYKI
jgi:hypothetical protein